MVFRPEHALPSQSASKVMTHKDVVDAAAAAASKAKLGPESRAVPSTGLNDASGNGTVWCVSVCVFFFPRLFCPASQLAHRIHHTTTSGFVTGTVAPVAAGAAHIVPPVGTAPEVGLMGATAVL